MTDPKASKLRLPTKIRRPCTAAPPAQSSPPSPSRCIANSSVMLTEDTDSFIIGDRVWVGGTKPGSIAYIGETQFAPGDWAGVVLDEPIGKNDGSLAGLRYFQCEPKRGIFSRLTRLTRQPLTGTMPMSPSGERTPSSFSQSSRGNLSKSMSPSLNSSLTSLTSVSQKDLRLGDRVIVSSSQGRKTGVLRYVGATRFAPGEWCGIELDDPVGKNDGAVDDTRYFECRPRYGLFTPSHKVSRSPISRRTSSAQKTGAASSIGSSYSRRISGSRESLTSVSSLTSPNTGIPSRGLTSGSREANAASRSLKSSPVRDSPSQPGSSTALLYDREKNQTDSNHKANERKGATPRDGEGTNSASNEEYEWLQKKYYEKEKRLESVRADLEQKMLLLHDECEKSRSVNDNLATERLEMAKSVEELKRILDCLRDENTKLEASMIEKSACLRKLEAEIGGVQKERDAAVAAAHEFNTKYNEALKQLEELNSLQTYTETESSLEFDCLREQLLQGDVEKKSLTERLEQSEMAVNELSEKLQEYACTIEKKESNESGVSETLRNARNSVRSLEERLRTTQKEFNEQLEERSRVNVELRERIRELESDLNEVKIVRDEKNKAEEVRSASVRNLKERLQTSQKEFNEQLEERGKAIIELQERIRKLESEISETKIVLDEKNKVDVIKDSAVRNLEERLQSSRKEFNEQLEERNKANSALEKRIESLESELSQTNVLLNEKTKIEESNIVCVKNLEDRLQTSQKEFTELLEERSKANIALQEQIRSLESELNETKVVLNEKIRTEESAIASVRDLEERLRGSQKELNEQLEERSEANIVLQERIRSLESEVSEMKIVLTEKDEVEGIKDISVKNLEERLQASQLEFNELLEERNKASIAIQEQIRSLESELSETKVALNEKIKVEDSAVASVRDLEERLQASQKELNEQLEERSKANIQLQERIRSLESEVSETKIVLTEKNKIEEIKDTLVKNLEERLQTSQKEFNERLAERSQMNIELQERIRKLELELSQTETEVHAKNMSVQEITDRSAKSLEERSKMNIQLQERINSLESELSKTKAILDEKNKNIEEINDNSAKNLAMQLQASQEAFNEQRAQRSKVNVEFQERIRQLESELSEMKIVLNDTKKAEEINGTSARNLEEQLQATQKEFKERSKLNIELQERIHSLESELSQTKVVLIEKSKIEEAKDTSVRNLEERLETSQKQFTEQLEEQGSANIELQERIRSIESELSETKIVLNEKSKNEESNVASVRNLEERLQVCQKEFHEQLEERSRMNIELQERIKTLESELSQTSVVLNEKTKIEESNIASVQNLEDQLRASRKEFTDQLEARSKANNELLERSRSLESELSEAKFVLNEKHKIEEIKDASVKHLEERLQNSQREFNDLLEERGKANIALQERIRSLELELNETKVVLNDKNKIEESTVTSVRDLEERLRASQRELNEQMEKRSKANIELQERNNLLESELSRTKNSLDDRDKLIEEMTGKVGKTTRELDELANTGKIKEAQIEEAARLARELQKENTQLHERIETLNAAATLQDTVVERMKQEIQNSRIMQENMAKDSIEQEALKTARTNEKIAELQKENEKLRQSNLTKNEFNQLGITHNLNNDKNEKVLGDQNHSPVRYSETVCDPKQENSSLATDMQKQLKELAEENETYKGQIEFLNSVIVDMQRKNEALKCKVEVLEIGVPASEADDYNRNTLSNRAAAPRMFCDICDQFDLHETEDCPRQAQDFVEPGRPMRSPKKPSIERPYCDNCESFGHDTAHCDDTETF